MSTRTPAQAADKWNRNLKNSSEEIRLGVEAVTTSPMEQAAAKEQKYLQGVQDAVSSGKWKRGLLSVSLAEWKRLMIAKGLPRLSVGADEAKPKVAAFYEKLFPFQDALVNQINQMPDTTFDDSINRMVAYARGMREFQG